MALKFVDEFSYEKKRVLIRFDLNVPLKDGKITDSTRIDMALPTLKYVLENGASKIILMSHLGRPKGKKVPELSLEPIAHYLAEKLGEEVLLTESAVDAGVEQMLKLPTTKIVLLENIRFHEEETKNDRDFAQKLSKYADIYINDAFGAAHRKHASTYEINAYYKNNAAGGFLLKSEIEALGKIVDSPEKPFMAIVGGAKVADKIKTLERLLPQVQNLFIGGAMAYPFLKAKGHEVGTSLCSDDDVKLAENILKQDKNNKLVLPIDHVVSDKFDGKGELCEEANIPDGKMGLDIGPETVHHYKSILDNAKTILWNGPMGVFENPEFNKGTFAIAGVLAKSSAFTVVGGGDSVSAVKKSGLAEQLSHVSTGGGASLEFIENGRLPGVDALKFGLD